MSTYDNDPRVRSMVEGQFRVQADDLYLVTAWGEGREERWNVTLSADADAYANGFDSMLDGPNLPNLYGTADEAIHSLIGEPQ